VDEGGTNVRCFQRVDDHSCLIERRGFARHDDEARATRRGQVLAPWACGQQVPSSSVPAIRTDEHNVRDATRLSVLERIVEHDGVASDITRLDASGNAVRRHDHLDVGVERAMDERLIITVAP
jgi:hypothetical protein